MVKVKVFIQASYADTEARAMTLAPPCFDSFKFCLVCLGTMMMY